MIWGGWPTAMEKGHCRTRECTGAVAFGSCSNQPPGPHSVRFLQKSSGRSVNQLFGRNTTPTLEHALKSTRIGLAESTVMLFYQPSKRFSLPSDRSVARTQSPPLAHPGAHRSGCARGEPFSSPVIGGPSAARTANSSRPGWWPERLRCGAESAFLRCCTVGVNRWRIQERLGTWHPCSGGRSSAKTIL